MRCIYCNSLNTSVSNSATADDGTIYRRRVCKDCGEKMYTTERPAEQSDIPEARKALWTKK